MKLKNWEIRRQIRRKKRSDYENATHRIYHFLNEDALFQMGELKGMKLNPEWEKAPYVGVTMVNGVKVIYPPERRYADKKMKVEIPKYIPA